MWDNVETVHREEMLPLVNRLIMWSLAKWPLLLFLLQAFGHNHVSVLDGGLAKWADEGYDVVTDKDELPTEVLCSTIKVLLNLPISPVFSFSWNPFTLLYYSVILSANKLQWFGYHGTEICNFLNKNILFSVANYENWNMFSLIVLHFVTALICWRCTFIDITVNNVKTITYSYY